MTRPRWIGSSTAGSRRTGACITIRQAFELPLWDPRQKRVFSVDFSKNEYTQGKQEAELEDYVIYVYSLEMLVLEKLRALLSADGGVPPPGAPRRSGS